MLSEEKKRQSTEDVIENSDQIDMVKSATELWTAPFSELWAIRSTPYFNLQRMIMFPRTSRGRGTWLTGSIRQVSQL